LVRQTDPVVEGRWCRAVTGYALRVGIDMATAPAAIYVRAGSLSYMVPYLDRAEEETSRALDRALADYGQAFLERFLPVPQAMEAEAERLRQHSL
jgi:hypothetical protein